MSQRKHTKALDKVPMSNKSNHASKKGKKRAIRRVKGIQRSQYDILYKSIQKAHKRYHVSIY